MAQKEQSNTVPVVMALTLFSLFMYGFYDFLTGYEDNGCDMTYMYEYPQFVRVSLPQNVSAQFPRYRLYAYGEGVYTEQLRDGKYSGIPVLFIPGNGGSYKQARSVASVAYRRSVDARLRHHLNVFTADLAEDLAGAHGRLLADQTRFVAHCLRAILRLYKTQDRAQAAPTSVVIIGHSMGGVVARGLFTLPGFDPSTVRLLYLLAAPIAEPPLRIDRPMSRYYHTVEQLWTERRNTTLSGVTVVSLSGGDRDLQVRPHLTAHPTSDISATTSSVPGVWVSADHQCIVWCRQLVMAVVRSLYDLVVPETRQLSADRALQLSVLRHHFVQRTHGKHYKNAFHPSTVPMDSNGDWKQYSLRQWTFTAEEAGRPTYLMIPLMNNPLYQRATLSTVNLASRDWLLACVASKMEKGVRMCAEGDNLSGLGEQAPSALGRRRTASLDLQQLREQGYTHLVVVVRPADDKVTVHCDVSRHSDRQLTAEAPTFTSFRAYFQRQPVLKNTAAGALHYNLSLTGLTDPWQAVLVHLTPLGSCGLSSRAALSFHVPWAQESRTVLLSDREGMITAKLQHPRPVGLDQEVVPYVTAHLDPACTYSISLQTSFRELWGQLARWFWPLLLPATLAVLLVTLAEQLRAADSSAAAAAGQLATQEGSAAEEDSGAKAEDSSSKADALEDTDDDNMEAEDSAVAAQETSSSAAADGSAVEGSPAADDSTAAAVVQPVALTPHAALARLTPLKLVMPTQILSSLLGWSFLAARLPAPDLPSLTARGITCSVLPFLMYFVSWGLVAVVSVTAWALVMVTGKLVHKLTSGLLSRSAGGSEAVAEVAVAGLARFPVLLSVLLSALAVTSCGEISLGIGLLVCCVKVLQSYEEVLSGGGHRAAFKAYTSLTLTLVWLWITVVHLPSLVVWSKTRSEGSQLQGDPSLVVALVLCNSGAILWRDAALRHDLAGYKTLAGLASVAGVGVYLFAMVNVYRASWLAAGVVMATALHQLMAPVLEREAEGEEEESADLAASADDEDQLTGDSPAAADGVRRRVTAGSQ